MADLSNRRALVFDDGNYPALARRLAREFGEVMYFKPWKGTAPETAKLIVGRGYGDIIRVRDFWDVKDKVDLFVFPDIYDGDLQLELERQGFRVWGSRKAEEYEYRRGFFLDTCKEVGLETPKYKKCVGVTALREYLAEHDDLWIKVEMRGDRETWHHRNITLSTPVLDALAYYYGPVKELVPFWAVHNIDTDVEASYDGYEVTSPGGAVQWPKMAFLSYETKNMCSIVHCVKYTDLAEPVRMVNEKFGPKLAERNNRSQFGTEIKIDGDTVIFLDSTNRMPSPPGEMILELVTNLGEVFYEGAIGELVEMDLAAEFAVQVNLYSDWAGSNHLPIQVPEEIDQWVKLGDCCRDEDGIDWIVPKEVEDPISGWRKNCGGVVAIGPSIEKCIELVKERCEQIESLDTEAQIECLAESLRRIHHGEAEGIPFAEEVPEPATVIEE